MSNEMNTVNQKNTQTPVEQTADGRYKVTKRDLRRTAARYNFMACNIFNYESQMGPAVAWAMAPVLRKIYKDDEEYKAALNNHFNYYNSTTAMSSVILGATLAIEEKDGIEAKETVQSLKTSLMGPWEYVEAVDQYYLHCFAKEQPDLNWDNPKVREDVYDILRFWLDKGIDGFRMDVITLISKDPTFPDGPIIQNKAYGSYYAGCASGPRVHEYLKEMNREVLSKYDIMTVGEAPHTSADEAVPYTAAGEKELQMVFHFDHMHLDYDENGKYAKTRVKLTDLKRVMTEWQEKMHACNGWNSLYWSNHDQARAVTRFGNESPAYRVISAKMLGTVLHMMQGTPYIFEGEELGMTNAFFDKIEDYRDLEAIDIFKDFTGRKGFSEKDTLELLRLKSRDNARTPMQWDDTRHAGFTEGTPWIDVNPNYTEINAEKCLEDSDSVFYYYQKLVKLRHEVPVITDGEYELLDAENEKIYTYLRKGENESLVVAANFTDEEIDYQVDEKVKAQKSSLLISNYGDAPDTFNNHLTLKPYQVYVYMIR